MQKSSIVRACALALGICVPTLASASEAQTVYNGAVSACMKTEANDRAQSCTGKTGDGLAACTSRLARVRDQCLERASRQLADTLRFQATRAKQLQDYEAARAAQAANRPSR